MYPNSALFGVIFAAVFVISMVLGVLLAIKRGFFPALIRLGLITACFLITIPLVLWISDLVSDSSQQIMHKFLGDTIDQIAQHSPTTMDVLCHMPMAIIAPGLFISIFFLLKWLTLIVFRLLSVILPSRSSLLFRILGGVAGALTSLVCLIALWLPLWGILGASHMTVQTLCNVDVKNNAELASVTETIEKIDTAVLGPTVDNFTAEIFTDGGDSALYRTLTKFELGGKEVALSEELAPITETAADALSFVGSLPENFQITDLTADQIATLHTLTDDIDQSTLLENIFAEWLSAMAKSWKNGEAFMGMADPSGNTQLKPILHTLYDFLSTTNADLLAGDLDTFIVLLDILVTHNILSPEEGSNMLAGVSDPTFVDDISVPLESNDRLRTSLADLIASMGGAWADGTDYMGLAAPQSDASYNSLIRTLYRFLATTNEELILSDFETMSGLVSLLKNNTSSTNMLLNDALLTDLNRFLAEHIRFRGYFAEWMSALTGAWADGKDYEGMAIPKVNELLDPVMNKTFSILATTTEETICDDLTALTEIVAIMRGYDVFNTATEGTQMAKLLMNTNFVSDLTATINRHERFKPLLDIVTGLGLSAISSQLPTKLPDSPILADLSSSISTSLTASSGTPGTTATLRADQVRSEVIKVLATNNVDVPDGVVDLITDVIMDEFGDRPSVNEQEVTDYLLTLYTTAGDLDGFF